MGLLESDTTERLHFHFSLSCIGEGNGNPPQCSCLENPRDGEPGGLLYMVSHRVRHDWSDLAAAAAVDYICVIPLSYKNNRKYKIGKLVKWGITINSWCKVIINAVSFIEAVISRLFVFV